jgi:hypothetical protein
VSQQPIVLGIGHTRACSLLGRFDEPSSRLCTGDRPFFGHSSVITFGFVSPRIVAHTDASLCQVLFWGRVLDAGDRPCLAAGLVVGLVLGPGSDLSEEPVYQGVSRPRWNQRRPWVSSRTHYRSQMLRRRASARRRR